MKQNHLLSVRNVTVMAMFGALAAVLMIFEVPLPFIAPSFYGMDISEVPVLVACGRRCHGAGEADTEAYQHGICGRVCQFLRWMFPGAARRLYIQA